MTESVCPVCLARIPAERRPEGDRVYLAKTCPEHGEYRTLVWRGEPALAGWTRSKRPLSVGMYLAPDPLGCPFDCGICPEHRQQSCTVLIEVTARCNLACAFCFASSGGEVDADPTLDTIAGWFGSALRQSGPQNIVQISGGEPTVRNDLAEIIALGRKSGFPHIQLNTNGLRLAGDPRYAAELKEAGLFSVFLQFDGTNDDIYRAIRGHALLAEKLRAIENCAAAGLGVVLVPTLVHGINTEDVGNILRLALDLAPAIRGVHFQPASYFGRHPGPPRDNDRVTLPDLMRAIEEQTGGLMKVEDFAPPGAEHIMCSFHGNFLREADGCLKPLTPKGQDCSDEEQGTARAVAYVTRQWSAPASSDACCCATNSLDDFVEHHRTNTFAVSAMAFQDVWNLDLERLHECCIHVVAPDGRMIPFCAYNLTSVDGRPLYRRRGC
ncbi:MAG: radical SAM (seleno)protein TrsS [Coriobacteriia bacterium]